MSLSTTYLRAQKALVAVQALATGAKVAQVELARTADQARQTEVAVGNTVEATRSGNKEIATLLTGLEGRVEHALKTVRDGMSQAEGWADAATESLTATAEKTAEVQAAVTTLTQAFDGFQGVSRPEVLAERLAAMQNLTAAVLEGAASVKDVIQVLESSGSPVFKRALDVLKAFTEGRATLQQLLQMIDQVNANLGPGNALADLLEAVAGQVPS